MGNYYLIARDVKTNNFKIIELKSKWYLKNGTDVLMRGNRLEAIDLVTTRFASKNDMADRLRKNGYIDFEEVDFYIVSKYKRNGIEKLKYQEVIYNTKQERTNYFREISYNSLNNNIKCEKNIRLIDRFINKSYYVPEYLKIVREGLTAIPHKFSQIFNKLEKEESIPYKLKYQNSWCLENYILSRSIIDSFNRFDELNYQDIFKNHVDYFNNLSRGRSKIHNKLLEVCDKDYVFGQLSIFDMNNYKAKDKVDSDDVDSFDKVSLEDKKKYVIDSLTHLGFRAFTYEDNQYKIMLDEYVDYIEKDELKKLIGISPRIVKFAYLYNLHKAKMNNSHVSYGSYLILQEDLQGDLKDLKNLLKSDKMIEKTYDFCKTFDNIKSRVRNDKDVKDYKKK